MQETPFLLDTNILLAYIRGGPLGQWIESNYQLRARSDRPVISVVSKGEILALSRRLHWGEDKQAGLRELLGELVVLDINVEEIIGAYADLDDYTVSQGRTLSKNDLWIAATAHVVGTPVLTTDKDFDFLAPRWLRVEWVDQTQFH